MNSSNGHRDPRFGLSPLGILRSAIEAVPAVRFALGIGGIAAVVAIALVGWKLEPQVAVFGTLVVLVFMVALVVFAAVAATGPALLQPLAIFMAWAFLIVTVAAALLFVSCAFFDKPKTLPCLLQNECNTDGNDDSPPSGPEIACNDDADRWYLGGGWRVAANSKQVNSKGIPHGWNQTYDPSRENQPDWSDRQGILVLHPLSETEPAMISHTQKLPPDSVYVAVTAAGSPSGDGAVRVLINGKKIGSRLVKLGRWAVLDFPVRKFSNSLATIKIEAAAGGSARWNYETVYIDSVCVITQRDIDNANFR
jgi:hypothetical protein